MGRKTTLALLIAVGIWSEEPSWHLIQHLVFYVQEACKPSLPPPIGEMVKEELQGRCSPPRPQEYKEPSSRSIIPEHIDGVEFLYASPQARQTYHQALDYILDNLPYEPTPYIRRKRMALVQELSFQPLFGIPDARMHGDYFVMDEKRAEAILWYLQRKE